MKKLLIFVLFFGQTFYSICQTNSILTGFDTESSYKYCLYIDSNDVDNIWQVGKPNKSIFNAAYSPPNALITDTINTYPTNNSSSVYVRFIKYDYDLLLHFYFRYKTNTDTLRDSCKVEFTVDNGSSWINLNDFDAYVYYSTDTLVASGNSHGWKLFSCIMSLLPYSLSELDTLLFKFTFSSDSINTYKDGWMIDDLRVYLLPEIGINENKTNNVPFQIFYCSNDLLKTISTYYLQSNNYKIELYDVMGHLVFNNYIGNGYENTYYLNALKNGIYLYKIVDIKEKEILQTGKIIVY